MWIEKIELRHFLVFEDKKIRFEPGLNVVVAPNEGGKSSLLKGIVIALYQDASSRKREVKNFTRWGSASMFRVSADLHLGSDHLRIERDFEKKQQAVYRAGDDLPLARDKSVDEYLKEHLTMPNEEIFIRICGVRQEELAAVSEGSAGVGERLEEVLGGGWGQATPQKVGSALEEKRTELRKGLDHPARPENFGPLRRLQDEIEKLDRELSEAEQIDGTRRGLLASISEGEKELVELMEAFEIRKTRIERAAEFHDCSKREEQARERAENKRKKKVRIEALLKERNDLDKELAAYPSALVDSDDLRLERYRDELREEERLAGAIPVSGKRLVKRFDRLKMAAAVFCILVGVLGALYLRGEFLIIAIMGGLLLVWEAVQLLRGGREPEVDDADERRSQLADGRRTWAGDRTIEESREVLDKVCRLKGDLKTVLVRLGEAAGVGDRKADYSDVLAELEKEYSEAALEWKGIEGERRKLDSYKLGAEELLQIEREVGRSETKLLQLQDSVAKRKRELAALDLKDTIVIRERLSTCRSDLERVKRRAEVIDIALETLERARTSTAGFLSNKLPPLVGELISRITGDRYQTVMIDHTSLKVTTVPAEEDFSASARDKTVPASIAPDVLSQGARDQLYLALRLALIKIMSARDSQPLLLDDPFVHFDTERRARTFGIIKEFAREHQVILFTCDPSYGDLGGHLIEL